MIGFNALGYLGRLGNQMFQFAALKGIARNRGFNYCLPPSDLYTEHTNVQQYDADVVGYSGKIEWDTSKPNGPPRKLLNVDKLHKVGWKHKIELREGIESAYKWYLENYDRV